MKTLLLGDVSPTINTDPYFAAGDAETLFSNVVTLFEGNDVNLVNMECALTDSEKAIDKFGPALKGSVNTAETLKKIGVNYCGLSNNHIFDFGIRGYKDTIEALEKAGIQYTGFGENYEDSRKNLIIEKDGEKICLIAVCEHEYSYALEDRMGSRPFDEIDTIEDIRNAKASCDRVIVTYHGGKEYSEYPSPRLRKVCQAMIRNGADVVLCQHSHCVGCYEMYENGHILYGQGNFHFVKIPTNKTTAEYWKSSLAVKYDTKSHVMEFIPLSADIEGATISIAEGEVKEEILKQFEERSAGLHNGKWIEGWQAFCEGKKETYVSAIKNAYNDDSTEKQNHYFAHFLDCQAHTDVWRELFPTANMTNEK